MIADNEHAKEHCPQDIHGVSASNLPDLVWDFLPFSHSKIFWPEIVEHALAHKVHPTHLLKLRRIE